MINASHDKEFVFHDGSRVKNLSELVLKIETLNDHDFHQFVNHHKNDFANWTEHVLADKHLAEKLRTVISRNETVRFIRNKIDETTVGNSIIKIPRIENHSEHNKAPVANDVEKHPETHKESKESHHEEHHHESHREETKEEVHLVQSHDKKDEKHEKYEESKAKHNWFQLFSKKKLSKHKLELIEHEEGDKLYAERELKEEIDREGRENALWVILYFALVLLIITLVVYKLFL